VLLIVPLVIVPIVVLGRRLRRSAARTRTGSPKASGNASEALLSVQTVQAFTHERPSRDFDVTETQLRQRQAPDRDAGGDDVIVISLVFAGIVGVLWIGARDVRAGR
jgi:ATP-binding cassette subfamily B protein